MDRSVYDNALAVLKLHGRSAPIKMEDLQREVLDLCHIEINERDMRDVLRLLKSEGERIIPTARGYWYFHGTPADIEAAERAAATLDAHADSEHATAKEMRKWCEAAKRERERETWRTAQQAGLFA